MDFDELFNYEIEGNGGGGNDGEEYEGFSETQKETNNNIGWVVRRNKHQSTTTNGTVGNGSANPECETRPENVVFYKNNFIPGSRIRNSMTGNYYPYTIGSKDEYLLFKVSLCTGEENTLTYVHKYKTSIPEPCLLFYDSPTEYEKHFFGTISDTIKEKWRTQQMQYKYLQQSNAKKSKYVVI